MMSAESYRSIRLRDDGDVCFVTLDRAAAGNTINRQLIDEITRALVATQARIVVLEGSPEVFCQGADFAGVVQRHVHSEPDGIDDPGAMYDVWRKLACGPFISVAHVRGKVNAGGLGFVAACDVVLSEPGASFGLSEMLFGLMPACVLPFLIRRIGFARANYLTLSTQPIAARQAEQWGLVDTIEENSEALLRKHLVRFKRLSKPAVTRYKHYAAALDGTLAAARPAALQANMDVFSDPVNRTNIIRYVTQGRFPWEES